MGWDFGLGFGMGIQCNNQNAFFVVHYPVSFSIGCCTFKSGNPYLDPAPAPAPIIVYGSGSGSGSDPSSDLRSGSGSGSDSFSLPDPDPAPAPMDTPIKDPYTAPAPTSDHKIR